MPHDTIQLTSGKGDWIMIFAAAYEILNFDHMMCMPDGMCRFFDSKKQDCPASADVNNRL